MLLSENITLANYTLKTMYVISFLGIVYWLFMCWYEGKKDGFDGRNMFDLLLSSVIFSGVGYYFINYLLDWVHIYRPNNILLALDPELILLSSVFVLGLIPVFVFGKIYKWSVFRLLDIYALGFSLLLFFLSMGKFLIYSNFSYLFISLGVLILYFYVLRYRGYKFLSGAVFSLFLVFLAVAGFCFYRRQGHLLFILILFTISILNLFFRRRQMIVKKSLPKEFIDQIRNKLLKKDKQLTEDVELLKKEDPYMQEGRTTDNAESMDEAILEDYQKDVTDARLGSLRAIRLQVRKALAAIKIGTYGKCEDCGKDISKERLKAYPEATKCIECSKDAS